MKTNKFYKLEFGLPVEGLKEDGFYLSGCEYPKGTNGDKIVEIAVQTVIENVLRVSVLEFLFVASLGVYTRIDTKKYTNGQMLADTSTHIKIATGEKVTQEEAMELVDGFYVYKSGYTSEIHYLMTSPFGVQYSAMLHDALQARGE